MDISVWKAKAKETKDKAVEVWRRNWKEILAAGVLLGIVVWSQSSNDNDEDNEIIGDGYDGNSISNPPYELGDSSANQTSVPRNHPKRDIAGIDVTGSSLMGYEKQFLENFSTQYDRFKGKEQTLIRNDDGFSSDGKYTRETTTKYSFLEDDKGINVNISYKDDDGQTGETNYIINKGRDLINFAKENKNLKIFNDVQDIVDM